MSENSIWTGVGRWRVDLRRRELQLNGVPVPIGARAFEIIEVLVRSANELVTKREIMDRIWPGAVVGEGTLQVHISAVRKALGPDRAMLETACGRGYRLLGSWMPLQQKTTTPIAEPGTPPVNNLPVIVERLIGRTAAARQVRDLVTAYPVVTLTGPGGIGKTSLAIEAARGLFADFEGGGCFVDLAGVANPDVVPSAVASALGLNPSGAISAESVARTVGEKQLLLVLDNCEHVIDAASLCVEAFMHICSRTKILTTSRETLRTNGEYVCRVAPLEVPAADEQDPDQIPGHSAVELFTTRLTALGSELSLQGETLPVIGAICRHLDGIPLAIEFAAAHAAMLGVQQVAAGLNDRFTLLTRGRRTAVPRHQTLRATLDWSHDLLPEAERLLLHRLAIFPAGFTFDAAASVLTDTALDAAAVTEGVVNLVTKSLLTHDESSHGDRWHLLETIRAYALEKLVESGQQPTMARRLAEYLRDVAVANATEQIPPLTIEDLRRYGNELGNIRAALPRVSEVFA